MKWHCFFFFLLSLHFVEGAQYRLHVHDRVLIRMYGEEDTEREAVVDLRGTLSYLFIKAIPAAGRTIDDVRYDLENRLKEYYKYVSLSVTPLQFLPESYTIAGEVASPGRKPLIGRPTVLSALCDAGGFHRGVYRDQLFEFSDLRLSFLAREGEYYPLNFERLVKEGDLSQDVPLQPGDYIHIKSVTGHQIFVLGEVHTQMALNYMGTISLAEAIAEAGDVTYAASNRAVVIRGSLDCPQKIEVDLRRILRGCVPDFILQPGDILYVPEKKLFYLREIVKEAIRTFVYILSGDAGLSLFVKTHPHARGDFANRVFVDR